jgi:hypothetical protein
MARTHGSERRDPAIIAGLRVRGFRSVVDVALRPGRLCALVGEAQTGKSNLLAAVELLLDRRRAPALDDLTTLADAPLSIEATLGSGERLQLHASRAGQHVGEPPPVLFLPAAERANTLVAAEPPDAMAQRALAFLREALAEEAGSAADGSTTLPAASLVDGLEACCVAGIRGLVLLIEEPELYLRPQAQRYLYRLLRTFAQGGNQVIYSTHSPSLLNVARLDELAIVSRDAAGTRVLQPAPVTPDEDFRLLSEFDATRTELLLARAALLVEGQTERLALPFVFAACGHDADRENVSIVECGGKANILFFGRVCAATGIPFVALHDRDGHDQELNRQIRALAGPDRTVVLDRDFETVARLSGRSHKPERAWRHFAAVERDELPQVLAEAVELVVSIARGEDDSGSSPLEGGT